MSSQIQTIKAVFNGGEMSPIMDGRTDSEKYATGCRMLENFMVRSYGGAFKRPGTRFGVTDSGILRVIPFRRSTEVNFVLAFKVNSIVVYSYTAGAFTSVATVTTDYTSTEIPLLHYIQLNDVMFFTCSTKHPKRLTRNSDGTWTFVDVPFDFAPVLDAPKDATTMRLLYNADDWNTSSTYTKGNIVTLPFTQAITGALLVSGKIQITAAAHGLSNGASVTIYGVGGATNANGTFTISGVATNTFLLDETSSLPSTYTAATGAFYVTTSSDYIRTFVYESATTSTAAIFKTADWTEATYTSSWNLGTTYAFGAIAEYEASNYVCITAGAATAANAPDGTAPAWVRVNYKSSGLQITNYRLISSLSTTFSADEIGANWLLSPSSTKRFANEVMGTSAVSTTTSSSVFIQNEFIFRTTWASVSAPITTVVHIEESLDQVNYSTLREWYINDVNEGTISYSGTAPNTGGWYRATTIRPLGTATTAARMTLEPVNGILKIPFILNTYSASTPYQFIGVPQLAVNSLIPNEVLGSNFAIWQKAAFSVSRGYPRTLAFHDQRLFFASTTTEPTRIWGSQTDDFYTFLTGALDTSAIDMTLAATQANEIQWLASFKRTMVIGTSGEEWTLDTGDTDSALTPANIRLRRWSRYGSSHHQPVLSGDSLLWLTRDDRLREFAYVFEKDGYSAPDMMLLAEHIPSRSTVEYITYSQSPDPIVWLVHSDGSWSGFTYDRENSVTAWHSHRTFTGDKILSLCTLYSSSTAADSLIFLTNRKSGTINLESIDGSIMIAAVTSSDVNYQSASDTQHSTGKAGFFCDCYSILTSTGTTYTVSANANLTSRSLILGTSAVTTTGAPIEATAGASTVTFVGSATNATMNVGLPYVAYIIPNRVEIQLRDGTAQMRRWRVARAAFRLFRSFYGQVWNRLSGADYTYSTRINIDNIDAFPVSPSLTATTTGYVTGQTLPDAVNHDWGNCLDIVIASKHPLPFNLTGMILDVEIDGTSGAGR
jgi:hypothetical protein